MSRMASFLPIDAVAQQVLELVHVHEHLTEAAPDVHAPEMALLVRARVPV